jgi:hypothetical protein
MIGPLYVAASLLLTAAPEVSSSAPAGEFWLAACLGPVIFGIASRTSDGSLGH